MHRNAYIRIYLYNKKTWRINITHSNTKLIQIRAEIYNELLNYFPDYEASYIADYFYNNPCKFREIVEQVQQRREG